jgi:hypothetical protein
MKQLGLSAPVFVKQPKLTKLQKLLQETAAPITASTVFVKMQCIERVQPPREPNASTSY